MPRIQRHYYDNNPEDWDYIGDFWNWLLTQSGDVWLLWARNANWDNADSLFEKIIDHPRCPLALAVWLFWQASPDALYQNHPENNAGSMAERIATNVEQGFYKDKDLYLDWKHNIYGAMELIRALRRKTVNSAYKLPRELLGPMGRRKAQCPNFDEDTRLDIADFMHVMDGRIDEDEHAYQDRQHAGGNFRILEYLDMPSDKEAKKIVGRAKGDLDALEALYGTPEAYELVRKKLYASNHGSLFFGWRVYAAIFGVGAIAIIGSLIMHRLREGHW